MDQIMPIQKSWKLYQREPWPMQVVKEIIEGSDKWVKVTAYSSEDIYNYYHAALCFYSVWRELSGLRVIPTTVTSWKVNFRAIIGKTQQIVGYMLTWPQITVDSTA